MWWLAPQQDGLASHARTHISYAYTCHDLLVLQHKPRDLLLKAGIRKAVPKGKEDLVRRTRLEVTIANVNILHVGYLLPVAKRGAARIVGVGTGHGGGEPSRGVDVTVQHVCNGIAGFHAALPGQQHGADRMPKILDPREVDNVSGVYDYDGVLKGCGHMLQERSFFVGEVVAARRKWHVAVLACRASYDYDGHRCRARHRLCESTIHRHLGIVRGPMSPPAMVCLVLFAGAPRGIHLGEHAVVVCADRVEPIYQIGKVGRLNIAAAPITHVEPVDLAATKHGDLDACCEWERPVVCEQHTAFGRGGPRKARHLGKRAVSLRIRAFVLCKPVAHNGVHDPLGCAASVLFSNVHGSLPRCYGLGCEVRCHPLQYVHR